MHSIHMFQIITIPYLIIVQTKTSDDSILGPFKPHCLTVFPKELYTICLPDLTS